MKHKQSGFTLIEVLIASAIIMASLGVLLQLFGSGLSQTKKAGQAAHNLSVQRTIERQFLDINPALQQEGEGKAGGVGYRWHAVKIEPFRLFYDSEPGQNRLFALFLITVRFEIGNTKKQFHISQLGWKSKQ